MSKLYRNAAAAAAVVVSALFMTPSAHSVWIGTPPATGTVQEIQMNTLHDLYYVAVKFSAPLTNCGGTNWVYLANKQPNGTPIASHDNMLRTLTAAKMAGRSVVVWHDMVTYTVFGSPSTVCIAQQITVQ